MVYFNCNVCAPQFGQQSVISGQMIKGPLPVVTARILGFMRISLSNAAASQSSWRLGVNWSVSFLCSQNRSVSCSYNPNKGFESPLLNPASTRAIVSETKTSGFGVNASGGGGTPSQTRHPQSGAGQLWDRDTQLFFCQAKNLNFKTSFTSSRKQL